MNQHKSKARQAKAKTASADAEQKTLASLFDRALKQARAETRRGAEAQRRKWLKLQNRKRKPVKRDLSQIKFPHWWKDRAFIQRLRDNQIPIEEQKAAVWYEATRRRPEVQQAWLKWKFLFGENGWQNFTTWVVLNLPLSWPELDLNSKYGIIEASYSPLSVPPEGCSTFPTDKREQMKVAMQVLRLPESNDSDAAQRFVEHARLFADAGFLIVAVDKKQNQAIRAAFEAIEALPPTFRKPDLKELMFHHLPPDISDGDKQALEEKQRQGVLTHQDFDELWRKYIKPTSNLYAPWHTTARVQERVFHKRRRQGKLIEEKQFNFESICRRLEAFDNGCISTFVNSVRL